jgi:primosomal protein N' (replication factor Y)
LQGEKMIAEVIINTIAKELNKTYDYIIPDSILKDIKIGSRVFVTFGRTKQEEGFVINIKKESEFANKEITKLEDNILTEENINLAKIMSKRYFCNISDCIRLMLPPGNTTKNMQNRVKDKTANFVYLKKEIEEIEFDIEEGIIKSEKQKRILAFLFKNEGIHIQDLELLTDTTRSIIKTLEKNGYIEIVEQKVERNPFINKNTKQDKSLKLTNEQQFAYDKINNSNYKEFLIYGVTGSRKN